MNFSFKNKFSLEEIDNDGKKVVMDKTISVTTNDSDEKIKVDHLDKDETVEKDVLKARKAEHDVRGVLALPLFRFEEKQKPELINFCKVMLEMANKMKTEDDEGKYQIIKKYINIPKVSEVEYLFDLNVSRNRELYKATPKELKIELISCYFEKKLKMDLDIKETDTAKDDAEYDMKKDEIIKVFTEFKEDLMNLLNISKTGVMKDTEIVVEDSEGDFDYGVGVSIFIVYKKLIDYLNARRGRESYSDILPFLDKEFAQSIEEQNNINYIEGTEAIADGMTEDSGDDEGSSEDEGNSEGGDDTGGDDEDFGEGDDEGGDDDFGGDDFGDGGDDDSDGGDNYGGGGGDSGGSEGAIKLKPGANPLIEINSKEKVALELGNLKSQIDEVLTKLEGFKANNVVNKLVELSSIVGDALKSAYIVPVEDSLMRYSLYVNQFEDLISDLKRSFSKNKK